ncbi:hypothetical protein AB0H57_23370 [Micromonospora sp. NPDC050686]|uniref:hypothetical protein n=1 Tax=Micromonospora sp. NPDC050686 TaxID=3154631 RepID=UPI0033C1E453
MNVRPRRRPPAAGRPHHLLSAERIFFRWNGTNSPAFNVHLRHLRENIEAMWAEQSPVDLRRWELGANSFQS